MSDSTVDLRVVRGSAVVMAGVAAAWPLLPHPPLCPMLELTGRPCPLCGSTRAVVSLLRGDVVASLRYSPLGIVVVAAVIVALVTWRKRTWSIPTVPLLAVLGAVWIWNLTLNPTFT